MLYKIAALINGEYVWVSEVVTREESLPRMYRILHAAYEGVVLRTFEGYDMEQILVAFLIASTLEKQKYALAQRLDSEAGKTARGVGGDHDLPYAYVGPAWGKQESIWCQLLGQVQRGEWREELQGRRRAGKKRDE